MRWVVLVCALALAACKSQEAPAAATANLKESYLAIGARLAADSTADVSKLADEVVSGAGSRSAAAGVADIVAAAPAVKASDIEAARAGFRSMSAGMIKYLVAHPDERAGLQLVHCSMTFGGEGGYWVQSAGSVANPYEGSRMLRCGDVTDWAEAPKS